MENENNTANDPAVQENKQEQQNTKKSMKSGLWIAIVAVVIIAAIIVFALTVGFGVTNEPIAVVNDQEITMAQFQSRVDRLSTIYSAQGLDVNAEGVQSEIESQVLEQLINETLILQEAQRANITATETEIEEAIAQDLASVGVEQPTREELATLLDDAGLTEAEYRENMRNLVIINKYVESNVPAEIDATPEEIQAFYDELAQTSTDEVPPLEEIEAAIEAQIMAQKRSTLIQEHVQELRAEATIETNYSSDVETTEEQA